MFECYSGVRTVTLVADFFSEASSLACDSWQNGLQNELGRGDGKFMNGMNGLMFVHRLVVIACMSRCNSLAPYLRPQSLQTKFDLSRSGAVARELSDAQAELCMRRERGLD